MGHHNTMGQPSNSSNSVLSSVYLWVGQCASEIASWRRGFYPSCSTPITHIKFELDPLRWTPLFECLLHAATLCVIFFLPKNMGGRVDCMNQISEWSGFCNGREGVLLFPHHAIIIIIIMFIYLSTLSRPSQKSSAEHYVSVATISHEGFLSQDQMDFWSHRTPGRFLY